MANDPPVMDPDELDAEVRGTGNMIDPYDLCHAFGFVDTLLYCPAEHAVHAVAANDESVFVTEPLIHNVHGCVDVLLYRPAPHALHVVAPVTARESVMKPSLHTAHVTVE